MPNPDIIHLLPSYLTNSKTYLVVVIDLKANCLFINPLFKQYCFSITEELIGLPFIKTIPTYQIPIFQEAISKCVNNPTEIIQVEISQLEGLQTTTDKVRWELSMLKDEKENTIGIICIGHLIDNNKTNITIPQPIDDEFYRSSLVVKNTSNAVIMTDKERKITWVNDGFTRLTGYTWEEAQGKNPAELLQCEESDTHTIQIIREKLNQALPVYFEILNKGKYGNLYWVEGEIQPLRDDKENLMGFMAIESDISQRKKAEEMLLLSETRLMANLNNVPNVAVQWCDENGRLIYWNPASEKLYGWKSEEVIGKTLGELTNNPEETEKALKIIAHIKTLRKPFGPYETIILRKDKSQRWVLATTFSIPLGNDKLGFVCMDIDITEQKKIANALTESEERYRSVVSAIGEGLVVQDIEDKIIMCNQSAADILGLTIEQLKGKDSYDPQWKALKEDGSPFAPEDHPTMITLRTGKPVDGVIMNVHTGDGKRRFITINSRPVLDHKGKMYGAVASFLDITIQKNALEDLKQKNQDLLIYQEQLRQNIEEVYASQAKIEEQKQQLEQEVNERKHAEEKIITQNKILLDIAWHQSHSIRRPVATILGLIDLINREKNASSAQKDQYLNYLLQTTRELDTVIHAIVAKTNEIEE